MSAVQKIKANESPKRKRGEDEEVGEVEEVKVEDWLPPINAEGYLQLLKIDVDKVPISVYFNNLSKAGLGFQGRLLEVTFRPDYPKHVLSGLFYTPNSNILEDGTTDKQQAWMLYYEKKGDVVFTRKLKSFQQFVRVQAITMHWHRMLINKTMHLTTKRAKNN